MNTKRNDRSLRLQRDTLRTLSAADLAAVEGGRARDTDTAGPECPGSKGRCPTRENC